MYGSFFSEIQKFQKKKKKHKITPNTTNKPTIITMKSLALFDELFPEIPHVERSKEELISVVDESCGK